MISLSLNHTRDAHWLMPQLQSSSYLLALRRENMHILTMTLMNIGNLDCECACRVFVLIWWKIVSVNTALTSTYYHEVQQLRNMVHIYLLYSIWGWIGNLFSTSIFVLLLQNVIQSPYWLPWHLLDDTIRLCLCMSDLNNSRREFILFYTVITILIVELLHRVQQSLFLVYW